MRKLSGKIGLVWEDTTPSATIIHGECIAEMRKMPDNSIDSIICDPPYGLGFMGKSWDALPPGLDWAEECLRVLKPGGHLLAFGGTRTFHRLACAIEDAGFEIRDSIAWLYGTGMPKNLDVSKAIDKRGGIVADFAAFRNACRSAMAASGTRFKDVRTALGNDMANHYLTNGSQPAVPNNRDYLIMRDLLNLGDEFDGQFLDEAERVKTGEHSSGLATGSAGLTRAGAGGDRHDRATTEAAARWQGWGTALKPAFEPIVVARKPLIGTVAENVLKYGTGAINIDANRIGTEKRTTPWSGTENYKISNPKVGETLSTGRWPANVMLDESMAEVLDAQSGISKSNVRVSEDKDVSGATFSLGRSGVTPREVSDSGGASRFFYVAKAPKSERPDVGGVKHPTVKPLKLMQHLCTLFTPPGGTILEPFAGSGTTVEAALLEGFNVIGIEMTAEYLPLIQARVDRVA